MMRRAGRLAVSTRAYLDAPARARLFAAMATLFIHLLAIGAAITWSEHKSPAAKGQNTRLTVFTIQKTTPPQSEPRPASNPKRNSVPQMGSVRTPSLPVTNVQGVLETRPSQPDTLIKATTTRSSDAAPQEKGRQREVSPSEMDAYKMLLWREIAARRPRVTRSC